MPERGVIPNKRTVRQRCHAISRDRSASNDLSPSLGQSIPKPIMRAPNLLAFVEQAGRFALHRRGFESRTISTPLAAVHAYEARGGGPLPPAIVIHGIGSSATSFAPVLMRLRPHVRRVVGLDLPGHGFSGAPTARVTPEALYQSVLAALDVLVHEPILLIGNSLGGAMALRYAMDCADKVSALALLSPAGARIDTAEWEDLLGAFRLESIAEARRLLDRLYHRLPWYMHAFAPGVRANMQCQAVRDLLGCAKLDDMPAPERLGALSMPVLLFWGQSERVMPPSALAYFRRHLPERAIVEEPTGFGHCPHFDDPSRLAERILDFARQSTVH
jgi:pimeloyl-ACP methyl ester carboxylesterase